MTQTTPVKPAEPVEGRFARGALSSMRPHTRRAMLAWARVVALALITSLVLVPIITVFALSLRPGPSTPDAAPLSLDNFVLVFSTTDVLLWLTNSLGVTAATVVVSIIVAAPAGYVLSRGRSRAVSGYSLLLFVVQSLPVITSLVPLFILFARLGLADNLIGLVIVYVGGALAVATWMMAAYFDSIPHTLEEAAWVDGCTVFQGFTRIVLRNSLPGVLSTAIFTFLVAWNDYLVALIFLRSSNIYTLPVGLQSFFQQNTTDWTSVMACSVIMLMPPVIIFTVLNRYFSIGGIGGSLAGR